MFSSEIIGLIIIVAICGGALAALIVATKKNGREETLKEVAEQKDEYHRKVANAVTDGNVTAARSVNSGDLYADDGFRRD